MSAPHRTLPQRMADMEARIDLLADAMLSNEIEYHARYEALIDGLTNWFLACRIWPRTRRELSRELSELCQGIAKADRTAPTHSKAVAIAGKALTDE